MDYDRIILELLNRVSVLEEKVDNMIQSNTPEGGERAAVGKKYRFLADYLHDSGQNEVRLSFEEIEKILCDKLPLSAEKHRAFWANTDSHSIALSWMSVGYQTVEVNMEKRYVVFEKRRSYEA